MKIIAFIEQEEIIEKILKHLGLWEIKRRPPPRIHSPPAELYADYSDSQIPHWDDNQTSGSHIHILWSHFSAKRQHYYH